MARGFVSYRTRDGEKDKGPKIVASPSWSMVNPVTGRVTDPRERFLEQQGRGLAVLGPQYYQTDFTPAEAAAYQQTLRGAGSLYEAGMTPEQLSFWVPNAEAEGYAAAEESDTSGGIQDLIKLITGSGTGTTVSASDRLAARKYADERADREAKARAYQQYLSGGRLAGGFAGERSDVAAQYENALRNIASGYSEAQGLTERGYNTLRDYLQRNAVNPYQGMEIDAGLATNPMEQFLQAYGSAGPEVQAAVAAEQAAREGGAGAFRSLVDVLSGASTEAQRSRMAETEMAANLAASLLGQQRAGITSQAELARQRALADIAQREADRQFAIEQALIDLGQFPAVPDSGEVTPVPTQKPKKKPKPKPKKK